MHRIKRCRRQNPMPWRVLSAVLRAERGQGPAAVRKRRRRLISDRGLALTVYTYILAGAAIVTSLAYGLVTSQ